MIAAAIATLLDVVVGLLLLGGAAFTVIAALGVVRMEDVYVRMHASTKAATLGLMLVVAALALSVESAAMIEKALALFLLVLATAPVSAHLVGRAVWRVMTPVERDDCAPNPHDDGPPAA
jgi:multicomponent Na+:H+ antiporter subunit G